MAKVTFIPIPSLLLIVILVVEQPNIIIQVPRSALKYIRVVVLGVNELLLDLDDVRVDGDMAALTVQLGVRLPERILGVGVSVGVGQDHLSEGWHGREGERR